MTDFKKQYEAAKKAGKTVQRTAKYIKLDTKGELIVGRFISSQPVASNLGGDEYNQYLFETDEGLIKFALGRSADHEIGAVLVQRCVYAIEFLGQESIAGGRRVNKFNMVEVPAEDGEVTIPED